MNTSITYAKPPEPYGPPVYTPVPVEKQAVPYTPDKNTPWWEWKLFPSNQSEGGLTVTPEQMKAIIDLYEADSIPVQEHCTLLGVDFRLFYKILNRFPEVDVYYRQAQKNKAHSYNRDAIKLYQDKIPEEFWQIDKLGNRVLTMAGVRYLENKKDLLLRQAEIHENGTYQQRVQVDTRNVNVNLNANLDIDDLEKMSVEALMRPND
jgi:hypothetical protein